MRLTTTREFWRRGATVWAIACVALILAYGWRTTGQDGGIDPLQSVIAITMFVAGWMLILVWHATRNGLSQAKAAFGDTDDSQRRSERANGIVIGGAPSGGLFIDNLFHALAVAEFSVEGQKLYAPGPIPVQVTAFDGGEGESYWSAANVLYASHGDLAKMEGLAGAHEGDALHKYSRMLKTYYNQGKGTCETWSAARYACSVLSVVLPVGSEVTVAYDPDDPQGNCAILPPVPDDATAGHAAVIRPRQANGFATAIWLVFGAFSVLESFALLLLV